jgi:hypothetical protein
MNESREGTNDVDEWRRSIASLVLGRWTFVLLSLVAAPGFAQTENTSGLPMKYLLLNTGLRVPVHLSLQSYKISHPKKLRLSWMMRLNHRDVGGEVPVNRPPDLIPREGR